MADARPFHWEFRPEPIAVEALRVEGGRIIVQEHVDLPEGAEVQLQIVEDDEEMSPEERARLHASLARDFGLIVTPTLRPIHPCLY